MRLLIADELVGTADVQVERDDGELLRIVCHEREETWGNQVYAGKSQWNGDVCRHGRSALEHFGQRTTEFTCLGVLPAEQTVCGWLELQLSRRVTGRYHEGRVNVASLLVGSVEGCNVEVGEDVNVVDEDGAVGVEEGSRLADAAACVAEAEALAAEASACVSEADAALAEDAAFVAEV